MKELQNLMDEISSWSDKTFGEGQRNPAILYHLKKEVVELIEAVEEFQKENTINDLAESEKQLMNAMEEYVDCMMLLLDSAAHFGFGAESLLRCTAKKLSRNKTRKWGQPDCNGVVEHIREEIK